MNDAAMMMMMMKADDIHFEHSKVYSKKKKIELTNKNNLLNLFILEQNFLPHALY